MNNAERIIIALDYGAMNDAVALVERLGDEHGFYKVGLELYTAAGDGILEYLRGAGKKIFLDLKLHDIPNTVRRAASAIAAKGAAITTVHTLGGVEMMRAAKQGTAESGACAAPLVVGVTILTSIDEDTMRNDLRIERSIPTMVRLLAESARNAGLDGVVASPLELSLLREHHDESFAIVTPGICPEWAAANDQKRMLTPKEAFERGATYIVIGRPVTAAADPLDALHKIQDEVSISGGAGVSPA